MRCLWHDSTGGGLFAQLFLTQFGDDNCQQQDHTDDEFLVLGVDAQHGQAVLDAVGLNNHANQFPAHLSGGEQQRVSIARAVAKQPTMLLCDEPTGALDSKTGVLILSLLQDMSNNKDTTVVIVTHNAILAEAADKVIRIKNGQVENIVINENPQKVTDLDW